MEQNPSRRDVVKMAGAASAAIGPFIQKVKAANDQVQFGFIGTGSRGTYLLGPSREKLTIGHCAAICDLDQEHLDKAGRRHRNESAKGEGLPRTARDEKH